MKYSRSILLPGIILGLGLGGFFDGIVFHQLLQWHHMLTSAGYPPNSVVNLQVNTLWDGLFHTGTYILTVIGVFLLWREARREGRSWSAAALIGALLIGWGIFNLAEGLIDHFILGIHHVRDDLPPGPAQQAWDFLFLGWGAVMVLIGWALVRQDRINRVVNSRSS